VLSPAGEEVRVVGGGTWVVPELQRGREPVHLVSLRRLPLAGVEVDNGLLRLGAMVTYADLEASSAVRRHAPVLDQLARGVTGGPQIHVQGTIGGAAVAARPQSDVPAALCALGATLVVRSASGARHVAAADFFLDAHRSDVRAGEVLTEILVPVADASCVGHGYVKVKGAASSWPVVTAAAVVRQDPDPRACGQVSVGGLARRPMTVDLGSLLGAAPASPDDLLQGVSLPAPADPWQDELAPADYRSAVAPVAVRRALLRAVESLEETRRDA